MAEKLQAPSLDYLGVAFGLTPNLFRFWSKNGFRSLYIRQSKNEVTGEHTVIMVKPLKKGKQEVSKQEINFEFLFEEFKKRFVRLLSMQFREMDLSTCISILDPNLSSKIIKESDSDGSTNAFNQKVLSSNFNFLDLKRLDNYSRGMVQYHMIRDLVPSLSESFFLKRFGPTTKMSYTQCIILLAMGLQHRNIDWISEQASINVSHCLALFNKAIKKMTKALKEGVFKKKAEELGLNQNVNQNLKVTGQNVKLGKRQFNPLKEDSDGLFGKLLRNKRNRKGKFKAKESGLKKIKGDVKRNKH